MRKIILYIAVSVDNFIALEDGSVEWLDDPALSLENEDYGYSELMDRIDTTLMGNNTYRMLQSFEIEFPYQDKTNFVFTRDKKLKKDPFVTYISGDVLKFTKELKEANGKDIWLIGGGEINTLLANHRMVDEIILTRIPVILGKGIPLFAEGLDMLKLELKSNKSYPNGMEQVTYIIS